MQFHLDGFRTGDPRVSEAAQQAPTPDVDVLIVGSGPAGLTLAAQLCAFADLRVRIVEQKPGPLLLGQADGIACRTMEMFEAFGFSDRVASEAYWVNETCFWNPDPADPRRIRRSRVVQDVEDGLSEFPHVILNQARVHDFFLDVMAQSPSRLQVEYGKRLVRLQRDPTANLQAHGVTVQVQHSASGSEETIRARCVVGCDGARSSVRQSLGWTLEGDSANQAWGVMDVLAVTDFPDIRRKAAIHSAEQGSLLVIPREGGYLVRLYIELDKLAPDQRVANLNVTTDHLVAAAQRILHPFTLDVKQIAWWSVYEIGQRLCSHFDDLHDGADADAVPRVFIAGDACHTHSPKAGQGMNVSMQDAFNLGWKLAAVLRGRAAPSLLATYGQERHHIARELIEFDHTWARMFSARPKTAAAPGEGIDPEVFQAYFVQQGRFTAGVATRYAPSLLTGEATHQALAGGFEVGTRFHSAPVIRLADAKPLQLGHRLRADGRWRVFAFADAAFANGRPSRLHGLLAQLAHPRHSPLRRALRPGEDLDAVIELIAICQQSHRALKLAALPALLRPAKGRHRLVDYEKVYCPDLKAGQDIFDLRSVDRDRGALVVVRPDQYVAQVLPLDAYDALCSYFSRILVGANP